MNTVDIASHAYAPGPHFGKAVMVAVSRVMVNAVLDSGKSDAHLTRPANRGSVSLLWTLPKHMKNPSACS